MLKGFVFFWLLAFSFGAFSQAFKLDPIQQDSNLTASKIKVIRSVQLIGNKKTKPHIILRELNFDLGDSLSNSEFVNALEQSKKNLHNTSLFNFVKIEWALLDSVQVFIVVTVLERWYTFPVPIFEIDDNNFNTWWKNKDLSRINYGMHLIQNNFRGRKEKLSLTAQFGFTERFRIRYDVPYISKSQKSGMGFYFSYNRLDEIAYTSESNKRLLYKNFGEDAIKNYSGGINFTYRNAIYNIHSIGLEFDKNVILDTVKNLNPTYLGAGNISSNYWSLYYSFVHDRRDSKQYPLSGNYLNLSFRKSGLGLSKNSIDLGNFNVQIKKYIELGKRIYFASLFRGEYALNNNQPYLLQNGLGYSPSYAIRGYEFYVIDGQNIGLVKGQVKYQLIQPKEATIPYVKYEKINKFHYSLYFGIYCDFAYVDDNTGYKDNRLANDLLSSVGAGLDFISYYDFVFRTEFSVNKFGESGIFIHFVAPI